ncbi:MAG: SpoIID/LytB domain-containing protein [Gammaproteobacteria bacterium]|nr:SpoIID/LytB domain-containing protein [Gammaproteobacteria bacterium]
MKSEPATTLRQSRAVAVGLRTNESAIPIRLLGDFTDQTGNHYPGGSYRFSALPEGIRITGPGEISHERENVILVGNDSSARFAIPVIIGKDFHWREQETLSFEGALRVLRSSDGDGITAVNIVDIETYIASVVSSEMNADCPDALIRSHSIISRSWLLAQRYPQRIGRTSEMRDEPDEIIRWYDRTSHDDFDVCADDHCQRYYGVGPIGDMSMQRAVEDTHGQVLTYGSRICDARFSKCCGGITEDARTAWSDESIPYLTPVPDLEKAAPLEPADDEISFRKHLDSPSAAYCNCTDDQTLKAILPDRDRRTTQDFFRWNAALTHSEVRHLVESKLGVDMGRVTGLHPVERGPSGRLSRLLIAGDKRRLTVGKELEIRRVLSTRHLLSSAFAVSLEGPGKRPSKFLLSGAGWGHGVGLCQIGAAVMATRGIDHRAILSHYYANTRLETLTWCD